MVASKRKKNTIKGFAEEELKESPMLGFVGCPVTRSRSKDSKLLSPSPLVEGYSPEDTKVASDQKKKAKAASYQKKKNAKVTSDHKRKNANKQKKNAKGVPKKSKKAVAKNPTTVGLTSEELQKYSREDFNYTEFHGPAFDGPPLLRMLTSRTRPIIPKYILRGNLDVVAAISAMEYYNR